MAVTPNLNLYKPSREDYISVTRDISENMDKIDTGYGNLQNSISSVDDTIGIVVNGNTSSKNITAGQFVIVKNSTISGVTDGLYTAVNNVASETALVAADLSSSNTGDGGLNALNSKMSMYELGNAASFGYASEYTAPSDGLVIAKKSDSSSSLTLTIVKGSSTIEVGRTTVNNAALHLWVRKGMKVKTGGNDNNSTNSFYPLE